MKNSIKILLLFAFCSLAACSKYHHNQYSEWRIIGKGDFRTNKVISSISQKQNTISLKTKSTEEEFTLAFDNDYNEMFPQIGNFVFQYPTTAKNTVALFFRLKDSYYIVTPSTYKLIKAQSFNGKAKYVLDTTWFYNQNKENDSAQIYGTFLEP